MAILIEQHVQPLVEREYLQESGVRDYLDLWCRANDKALEPIYLNRAEWEEKIFQVGLIDRQASGTRIYLPTDLKLWEMITAVYALDDATFSGTESAKGERAKLKEAINLFRQTAFYLKNLIVATNWDKIEENQTEKIDQATQSAAQLAKGIATEFYQFGRSMIRRTALSSTFEDIPIVQQSQEEKFKIEEKLMGAEFVRKRWWRLYDRSGDEPSADQIESAREVYFKSFFKALSRDYLKQLDFSQFERLDQTGLDLAWQEYLAVFLDAAEGELNEEEILEKKALGQKILHHHPWNKSGPVMSLQLATILGLEGFFSLPKLELEKAIFRRGRQKLLVEIVNSNLGREKFIPDDEYQETLDLIGLDFEQERGRVEEGAGIFKLKRELQEVRESGASIKEISAKELEIVDIIQDNITAIPYLSKSSSPVSIIEQRQINCVGAVLIAGMIFDELGIKYLVGGVESHAVNFVVTSDGEVHFRDMRASRNNVQLSSEHISESDLQKIKLFASFPEDRVLHLMSDPDWYQRIALSKQRVFPHLEIYPAGTGMQAMVENNLVYFIDDEVGENANELLSRMIESFIMRVPNDQMMLLRLAVLYQETGKYEDAALVLYRIEQLTPEKKEIYYLWTGLFLALKRPDLAIEAARKAIMLAPNDSFAWENLVIVLEQSGDKARLEAGLFQARTHQDFVKYSLELSAFYENSGNYEQMFKMYEEVIEQIPDDQDIWLDYYQRRVALYPHDEESFREVCRLHWERGNVEAVRFFAEAAVQQNPGVGWAQGLLKELAKLTSFDIPSET